MEVDISFPRDMICPKCKSKIFEIQETETGNMNTICTSCKGVISPLHPDMNIKAFLQFWNIGLR